MTKLRLTKPKQTPTSRMLSSITAATNVQLLSTGFRLQLENVDVLNLVAYLSATYRNVGRACLTGKPKPEYGW